MDGPPMAAAPQKAPAFPAHGGKAAALMRVVDWRPTPLGPPATWPQSLKTLVQTILAADLPMMVAWGPQLSLLYNDSCIPMLSGRHPEAMGEPIRLVFRAGWTDAAEKEARHALEGRSAQLPATVTETGAGRGAPWHLVPVRGERGQVEGFLMTHPAGGEGKQATHSRDLVTDLRQRLLSEDPGKAANAGLRRLAEVVRADVAAYGELNDVGDGYVILGNWTTEGGADLRGHYERDALGPTIVGRMSRGLKAAFTDVLESELSHEEAEAFTQSRIRSLFCVPIMREGRWHAFMLLARRVPGAWSEDDAALTEEVTSALAFMRDVIRQRPYGSDPDLAARPDKAIDPSPDTPVVQSGGSVGWVADADGRLLATGQEWESVFGLSPGDMLGEGWLGMVHSADRDRWMAQLKNAVEAPGEIACVLRLTDDASVTAVLRKARPILSEEDVVTGFRGFDMPLAANALPILTPQDISPQDDVAADGSHSEQATGPTVNPFQEEISGPQSAEREAVGVLLAAHRSPAAVLDDNGRIIAANAALATLVERPIGDLLETSFPYAGFWLSDDGLKKEIAGVVRQTAHGDSVQGRQGISTPSARFPVIVTFVPFPATPWDGARCFVWLDGEKPDEVARTLRDSADGPETDDPEAADPVGEALETVLEAAPGPTIVLDGEGRILQANSAFYQLTGVNADAFNDKPLLETAIWPDDPALRERLEGATERALRGESLSGEIAILAEGANLGASLAFSPFPKRGGEGRRILLRFETHPALMPHADAAAEAKTPTIVSEPGATAPSPKDSGVTAPEATWHSVLGSFPFPAAVLDEEGIVLAGNAALLALTGEDIADAAGLPLSEMLPNSPPGAEEEFREALGRLTTGVTTEERLLLSRDPAAGENDMPGETMSLVVLSVQDAKAEGDRAAIMATVVEDLPHSPAAAAPEPQSDPADAHDTGATTDIALALALRAGRLGVWQLSREDGTLSVDGRFRSLFAWAEDTAVPDEIGIDALTQAIHPDDRPRVLHAIDEAWETGSVTVECRLRKAGGAERYVLLSGQGVPTEAGNSLRLIGVALDVTDRRRIDAATLLQTTALVHRVRRLFATVAEVIALTSADENDVKRLAAGLQARLTAMKAAHEVTLKGLTERNPPLSELIAAVMEPYALRGRIGMSGPPAILPRDAAWAFGLIVHELSAAALSRGGWSGCGGEVQIAWWLEASDDGPAAPPLVCLEWRERWSGDPVSSAPDPDHGSRLLEACVGYLGGTLDRETGAHGLTVHLRFSLGVGD